MEPKMTPNRAPNDPQRPPNSQKDTSKSTLDFWSNFSSILNDLGGVQNDPKKHPKTAFGAQGSLGGLQGTLWGAFGVHSGLILKLSGAKFRAF